MAEIDERVEQKLDKIFEKLSSMDTTLATLTANHERDHTQINVNYDKLESQETRIDSVEKQFAKIDGQVFLMKLLVSIAVAVGTLGLFIWQVWG